MNGRGIFLIVLLLTSISGFTQDMTVCKGDTVFIGTSGCPSEEIEITAALRSNKSGKGRGKNYWGVGWTDGNYENMSFTLYWENSDFGDISDHRFMVIEISRNDSILVTERISDGVEMYSGMNTVRLRIDDDGLLKWKVGAESLSAAGELLLEGMPAGERRFYVFSIGSDLKVYRIKATGITDSPGSLQTDYNSPEDFPSSESGNTPEGRWSFLDRDMNPKWARLGGRYNLGIRNNGNGYDIIYLDGGETNSHRWKSGMRKGRLIPTPFIRHYNLEWVDSMFGHMDESDECSASLSEDGAILTFSFPLDHSTLRFYRQK